MRISAQDLTSLEKCPRYWKLSSEWTPRKQHPKWLFHRTLDGMIYKLSNGVAPELAAKWAITRYLEICAKPGIGLPGGDPYALAQDFIAVFKTLSMALPAAGLMKLHESPEVELESDLEWLPLCFQDETGTLHRWAGVDRVTNRTSVREAHSWYSLGDMAALDSPMVLHLFELGTRSGSHLHSPWCRTWKHPVVPGRYAFQKQDGKKLSGDWEPIFYDQLPKDDPKKWVEMLSRDKVQMFWDLRLKAISPEVREDFRRDVIRRARELESAFQSSWFDLPPSRSHCDEPTECRFTGVCYPGEKKLDLRGVGLVKIG